MKDDIHQEIEDAVNSINTRKVTELTIKIIEMLNENNCNNMEIFMIKAGINAFSDIKSDED